jgi:hypothetical protein
MMKSLLMTALTFCGILFGLAATPVKAVAQDVTCTGMEAQTFSPGLLLRPQTVTATVVDSFGPPYGLCVSSDPTLKSGVGPSTVTLKLSCLTVNNTSLKGGTGTINWNNGRSSTATITNVSVNNTLGGTVAAFTGTVTGGEFTGDNYLFTITTATLNFLACLAPPGVTKVSGPNSLLFTKP